MASYTRGRARTLSDEEVVALYVGGLDSDTVAAKANCSAGAVLDAVRRAGQAVRPPGTQPGRRKRTLDEAAICRRYAEGASGPDIAAEVGCVLSTVYAVLRRHGVTRRSAAESTNKVSLAAAAKRRRKPGTPP